MPRFYSSPNPIAISTPIMSNAKSRLAVIFSIAGVSLGAIVGGLILHQTHMDRQIADELRSWFPENNPQKSGLQLTSKPMQQSQISQLVQLSVTERQPYLEALSQQVDDPEYPRARYLLAMDQLAQNQPQEAIATLANLETRYPLLAAHIIAQRAQAYAQLGDNTKAAATWQQLLTTHPNHPVAAEALYELGKTNPQLWQEAIAKFPAHPRSVEIAANQLKTNPNSLPLLRLLAQYAHYKPDYTDILDRLTQTHSAQLTPEDWEIIAFGYWEKITYGKAGAAYAKAPPTAKNRYRAGRGLQLGGKTQEAIAAYKLLYNTYPNDRETAQGLIHLSRLVDLQPAQDYLNIVIAQFPHKAPEALIEQSKVLDALKSSESAKQARQSVLTQYSKSEEAAKLRWQQAEDAADNGNLLQAWRVAQEITVENPDTEYAPEAAFWVGKWAQKLGRERDAKAAYEYVLQRYPESYYAWRSALMLGWNVGDFTTVRYLQADVEYSAPRPLLPAGSETLKELHQLGQDRDAWALWQVEFTNPMEPTVAQQFTDGIMRLQIGDYIDGIFMLDSLAWRDDPEEQKQYQMLRQQLAYWQALYPFPYLEPIQSWSKDRQLNPLLVTALMRQESRFMPQIKSVVGATGLMQVMPETAEWIAGQINLASYELDNPNDNIKLGTWYLNYTHSEYNNNSLLAVASYNAGPGNVADWLNRFGFRDPDDFVEKIPFPETYGYVKSVFGNYWNYLRLYNPEIAQKMAEVN
ncbi:transglycosylase SLT domain-containing protein [Roseofilum sp. BLCC_M154]|uniref:Transglycosylase SLT domain-containing protein n=1 Tax=Roseofilum acuticapitatum BLCC-M154 TaxID=3022444 RepID=A0ABT7ATX3_9CYAN|nr:transglycosylase SLT domain-containing protein [Roseofilum acuticapitatum]MDJ1169523.1 transglycosylase SLT domain-containing protein [Roseofilum acuticapitatum BLCC-M154]